MKPVRFPFMRCLLALLLAAASAVASADYGPECRVLATQLARDPGTVKLGDLDALKSCLSELQLIIVDRKQAPEPSSPAELACPPAPSCPACPTCPACPKQECPAEESGRTLKPHLPTIR